MIDPTQPLADMPPSDLQDPPKPIEIDDKLNDQQELFCQLYATDREFFCNGVQSYIEVYNPDRKKKNWYQNACSSASQILSNIKVSRRINEILEAQGLNNAYVDKQLEALITQHVDLKTKLGAIKEYNLLKSRIVNKLDHTTLGEKLPETKTIILDTRPKETTG